MYFVCERVSLNERQMERQNLAPLKEFLNLNQTARKIEYIHNLTTIKDFFSLLNSNLYFNSVKFSSIKFGSGSFSLIMFSLAFQFSLETLSSIERKLAYSSQSQAPLTQLYNIYNIN